MGTIQDHRKYAERCVAMAQAAGEDSDKALWLTLAQSWMRLAEHVARGETGTERRTDDEAAIEVQSSQSR